MSEWLDAGYDASRNDATKVDVPKQGDNVAKQDSKLLRDKGKVDGVGDGEDSILHQNDLPQMMGTLIDSYSQRWHLMQTNQCIKYVVKYQIKREKEQNSYRLIKKNLKDELFPLCDPESLLCQVSCIRHNLIPIVNKGPSEDGIANKKRRKT